MSNKKPEPSRYEVIMRPNKNIGLGLAQSKITVESVYMSINHRGDLEFFDVRGSYGESKCVKHVIRSGAWEEARKI